MDNTVQSGALNSIDAQTKQALEWSKGKSNIGKSTVIGCFELYKYQRNRVEKVIQVNLSPRDKLTPAGIDDACSQLQHFLYAYKKVYLSKNNSGEIDYTFKLSVNLSEPLSLKESGRRSKFRPVGISAPRKPVVTKILNTMLELYLLEVNSRTDESIRLAGSKLGPLEVYLPDEALAGEQPLETKWTTGEGDDYGTIAQVLIEAINEAPNSKSIEGIFFFIVFELPNFSKFISMQSEENPYWTEGKNYPDVNCTDIYKKGSPTYGEKSGDPRPFGYFGIPFFTYLLSSSCKDITFKNKVLLMNLLLEYGDAELYALIQEKYKELSEDDSWNKFLLGAELQQRIKAHNVLNIQTKLSDELTNHESTPTISVLDAFLPQLSKELMSKQPSKDIETVVSRIAKRLNPKLTAKSTWSEIVEVVQKKIQQYKL